MRKHVPFSRPGEQAIQATQEAALADAFDKPSVDSWPPRRALLWLRKDST